MHFIRFKGFHRFNGPLSLSLKVLQNQTSPFFTFVNRPFDKRRLKELIHWSFNVLGEKKTVELVEQLKTTGYHYATMAGISLSIEDLQIPKKKRFLLSSTSESLHQAQQELTKGSLTTIEYVAQLVDRWNTTNELLKDEVLQNFRSKDILNPVYMMAFSGARGNISQVRQLTGMRGLMADPNGQIINFPIQSNFREGLTLTEYMISCYGARKGVVDTALRTATSGYLTRRLVDVAHHASIRMADCGTKKGIVLGSLKAGKRTIFSLKDRLVGRILAKSVYDSNSPVSKIASRNEEINHFLANRLSQQAQPILVRSPLTCEDDRFICQLCYGWSLSLNRLVSIGESVGIIAAQSIGEPGTQLTMRTFHTGGVFSGDMADEIRAPFSGIVYFPESVPGKCVRTSHGQIAFLTKQTSSLILRKTNHKQDDYKIKLDAYSLIFVKQNQFVVASQVIAEVSVIYKLARSRNAFQTIYAEFPGEVKFTKQDLVRGFQNHLFKKPFLASMDLWNQQKILSSNQTISVYREICWILAAQSQTLLDPFFATAFKKGDWVHFQTALKQKEKFLVKGFLKEKPWGLDKVEKDLKKRFYDATFCFYLPASLKKKIKFQKKQSDFYCLEPPRLLLKRTTPQEFTFFKGLRFLKKYKISDGGELIKQYTFFKWQNHQKHKAFQKSFKNVFKKFIKPFHVKKFNRVVSKNLLTSLKPFVKSISYVSPLLIDSVFNKHDLTYFSRSLPWVKFNSLKRSFASESFFSIHRSKIFLRFSYLSKSTFQFCFSKIERGKRNRLLNLIPNVLSCQGLSWPFKTFLLNRLDPFIDLSSVWVTDVTGFLVISDSFAFGKTKKNLCFSSEYFIVLMKNFFQSLIIWTKWFNRFSKNLNLIQTFSFKKGFFAFPSKSFFYGGLSDKKTGFFFKKRVFCSLLMAYSFYLLLSKSVKKRHFFKQKKDRQLRFFYFHKQHQFFSSTYLMPLSQTLFQKHKRKSRLNLVHSKMGLVKGPFPILKPNDFMTSSKKIRFWFNQELKTVPDETVFLEEVILYPDHLKQLAIQSIKKSVFFNGRVEKNQKKSLKQTKQPVILNNNQLNGYQLNIPDYFSVKQKTVAIKKEAQKKALFLQQNLLFELLFHWQLGYEAKKLEVYSNYILLCCPVLFKFILNYLNAWFTLYQHWQQLMIQTYSLSFQSRQKQREIKNRLAFFLNQKKRNQFVIKYADAFIGGLKDTNGVIEEFFFPKFSHFYLKHQEMKQTKKTLSKVVFYSSNQKNWVALKKNIYKRISVAFLKTSMIDPYHDLFTPVYYGKRFLLKESSIFSFLHPWLLNKLHNKKKRFVQFQKGNDHSNARLLLTSNLVDYETLFWQQWSFDLKSSSTMAFKQIINQSTSLFFPKSLHIKKPYGWFANMVSILKQRTIEDQKQKFSACCLGFLTYLLKTSFISTDLTPKTLLRLQSMLLFKQNSWLIEGLKFPHFGQSKPQNLLNQKTIKSTHPINPLSYEYKASDFQTIQLTHWKGWLYAMTQSTFFFKQNQLILAGQQKTQNGLFNTYVTSNRSFSLGSMIYTSSYDDHWSTNLIEKKTWDSYLNTSSSSQYFQPFKAYVSLFLKTYIEKSLEQKVKKLLSLTKMKSLYDCFLHFYSEVFYLKKLTQVDSKQFYGVLKYQTLAFYYRLGFLKRIKLPLVNGLLFNHLQGVVTKRVIILNKLKIYWNKQSRYQPELLLDEVRYKFFNKKDLLKEKGVKLIFCQKPRLVIVQKARDIYPNNILLKQRLFLQHEKVKNESLYSSSNPMLNHWSSLRSIHHRKVKNKPYDLNRILKIHYTIYKAIWHAIPTTHFETSDAFFKKSSLKSAHSWFQAFEKTNSLDSSFWLYLRYRSFLYDFHKKQFKENKMKKNQYNNAQWFYYWTLVNRLNLESLPFFKMNNPFFLFRAKKFAMSGLLGTTAFIFPSKKRFLKQAMHFRILGKSMLKATLKPKKLSHMRSHLGLIFSFFEWESLLKVKIKLIEPILKKKRTQLKKKRFSHTKRNSSRHSQVTPWLFFLPTDSKVLNHRFCLLDKTILPLSTYLLVLQFKKGWFLNDKTGSALLNKKHWTSLDLFSASFLTKKNKDKKIRKLEPVTSKQGELLSVTNSFERNKRFQYTKDGLLINEQINPVLQFSFIQYETKVLTELHYLTQQDLITYDVNIKTKEKDSFLPDLIGELVPAGQKFYLNYVFSECGQIIFLTKKKIVLRRGKMVLLSAGSMCNLQQGHFIKKEAPLLKLNYKEVVNEDIIQGIPKIEQLFEARSIRSGVTLGQLLHQKFQMLCDQSTSFSNVSGLVQAADQAIEFIQHYTLDAIQQVYQSQGVNISDKHVEIIIKQMTSKVLIQNPGNTGFLKGDLIDLQWLKRINTLVQKDEEKVQYEPFILGITQKSLKVDGFISAASFQETINVLTQAAYFRKTDFLGGLKENVILGYLIPVGTGFSF